MVESNAAELDSVFHALSDRTRRSILRDVARGEKSVSRLAQPYRISLAAVSKHLKVLDAAALIARQKRGSFQMIRLNASPLKAAQRWLADSEKDSTEVAVLDGISSEEHPGRVWATRRGLHVDRIASAWLIRRFIDPQAQFRFIDSKEEKIPGEVRFDMVGGDFTHEGDACTFETLVRVAARPDPALRQIAEIVHDIDLKDGKFNRPDAAGIQQIVLGIILDCPDDDDRLRRGFALFDDLYASFRRHAQAPSRSPSTRAGTRKGEP